ncbi:hypothetical protein [Nocardia sp. NPDC047038]|uniref:hypothetical protein n=1 Tax=Nocardia sp. NPDC047038 TaxID=3154338 RepID=UPI0033E43548
MFRLEREVGVSYSQIYVESAAGRINSRMDEAFAEQSSGLCGAAVPGALLAQRRLRAPLG